MKNQAFLRPSPQKNAGNVLVFILVAVFLLGALTALLMRTGNNTEETGETERLTLDVTQLMRYTASIQAAVNRMVMNGVSEDELSFGNTVYQDCSSNPIQADGHNPKCTSSVCKVFDPGGGAVSAIAVPSSLVNTSSCSWVKNGSLVFNLKRVEKIGNADKDELLIETYGLTKDACMRINTLLGIPNVSGDAPVDDTAGGGLFSGTFTQFGPQIGNEYTAFAGKKNFCLKNVSGQYSMFTVLVIR